MAPYGLKDGKPWLLGFKITKLDWNGPAEDFYQVSVTNSSDAPVDFTIQGQWTFLPEEKAVHRAGSWLQRHQHRRQ